MKLKCRPEDFRVEEIARPACTGGPFALYRLTKESLGTPEAVAAIGRSWRVERSAIEFGGLKDRHAHTIQYLSIRDGPRQSLRQTSFELEYVGQAPRPFDSSDILANRFEIALRGLSAGDAARIVDRLPRIAAGGLPNYFDDQRFGSVGLSGDFIARAWCLGDYERATWLTLAEANVHDRPRVRDEKAWLRAHWGDWALCRRKVERPMARDAMDRLRRDGRDFRRAFVSIPQHERRMFLGAFQSFLWNRILAATLREVIDSSRLFDVEIGRTRVPFLADRPGEAAAERLARPLPLPSSRERLEPGPLKDLYESVLAEFGLECRTLRVKYPRDSFFSRGSRAALFYAQSARATLGDDEQAAGSPGHRSGGADRKVVLQFDLPRGSYATVLVKHLAEMP